MSTTKTPRILLVVSNDFGELANALYFVKHQPFEVMLALPPRLYSMHGESLPVPVEEYRTPDDVLRITDSFHPDIVLLCSGYLFGVNGIFSAYTLTVLVAAIHERRCRVVTTDPFLGLFATPGPPSSNSTDPRKAQVADHFRLVAVALAESPHLYPARVAWKSQVKSHSFFNPAVTGAPSPVSPPLPAPDLRKWLFVLSAEDCNLQLIKMGAESFVELVIRRLTETASAGRQPVLVAPQTLIDRIGRRVDAAQLPILLPFCPLALFQSLLSEAEYVFFWNIYSNSVFHRVANALPVIFFDVGHIAHAIPALHQRALPTYYGSAPLPMHSQNTALDAAELSSMAEQQRKPFANAIAGYRTLPAPLTVVQTILRS